MTMFMDRFEDGFYKNMAEAVKKRQQADSQE
jgi:hypothetical protein